IMLSINIEIASRIVVFRPGIQALII
ncbi:unnamed protein product, partial [Rotaria sp. Silwood2]